MNDDQLHRMAIVRDLAGVGTQIREGIRGLALFDDDDRYRYVLMRWLHDAGAGATLHFCMLNPATADQDQDDPTIRRCLGFARRWGYSILAVTNLYAYRASHPLEMLRQADPIGRRNDSYIRAVAEQSHRTIVAWGMWGAVKVAGYPYGRGPAVLKYMRGLRELQVYYLGITKNGQPKHPLFLRVDQEPMEWEWQRWDR